MAFARCFMETLNKCILHMLSSRKREPSARLLSPNQSLA
jgi:hypothetical protein